MAGHCYLATYRPLIQTVGGRTAAHDHGLPPFIDGSCRREPDLESPFPSITAICRAGNFAPRLQESDQVVYLTVKGKYIKDQAPGWRLVAVLRVIRRFPNHIRAASWYSEQGFPPPSNCLVQGNRPIAFELTSKNPPAEVKKRLGGTANSRLALRLWDATYRTRMSEWPVFLATEAEFLELNHPAQLRKPEFVAVFGKVPGTQNPPEINCDRLQRLVEIAAGKSS